MNWSKKYVFTMKLYANANKNSFHSQTVRRYAENVCNLSEQIDYNWIALL